MSDEKSTKAVAAAMRIEGALKESLQDVPDAIHAAVLNALVPFCDQLAAELATLRTIYLDAKPANAQRGTRWRCFSELVDEVRRSGGIIEVRAADLRDILGAKHLKVRVRERLGLVLRELGIQFATVPSGGVPAPGHLPGDQNATIWLWIDGVGAEAA